MALGALYERFGNQKAKTNLDKKKSLSPLGRLLYRMEKLEQFKKRFFKNYRGPSTVKLKPENEDAFLKVPTKKRLQEVIRKSQLVEDQFPEFTFIPLLDNPKMEEHFQTTSNTKMREYFGLDGHESCLDTSQALKRSLFPDLGLLSEVLALGPDVRIMKNMSMILFDMYMGFHLKQNFLLDCHELQVDKKKVPENYEVEVKPVIIDLDSPPRAIPTTYSSSTRAYHSKSSSSRKHGPQLYAISSSEEGEIRIDESPMDLRYRLSRKRQMTNHLRSSTTLLPPERQPYGPICPPPSFRRSNEASYFHHRSHSESHMMGKRPFFRSDRPPVSLESHGFMKHPSRSGSPRQSPSTSIVSRQHRQLHSQAKDPSRKSVSRKCSRRPSNYRLSSRERLLKEKERIEKLLRDYDSSSGSEQHRLSSPRFSSSNTSSGKGSDSSSSSRNRRRRRRKRSHSPDGNKKSRSRRHYTSPKVKTKRVESKRRSHKCKYHARSKPCCRKDDSPTS